MSLGVRTGLGLALVWAGGFASLAPRWQLVAGVLVLGILGWQRARDPSPGPQPERSRLAVGAQLLALALAAALIARALAGVLVEVPAALWAVPAVGVALLVRAGGRREHAGVALLVALALVAGLAGARFEAAGEQAHGRADSGPIIGVHPRQAVGVRLDGHGPHDIVVDDYVDVPGGAGYDPEAWAARLELELHAIAKTRYADGPARARAAYERAEVRVIEAVVPPADASSYESLLGVEVRSGTSGEGSRVEFVCPGQTATLGRVSVARSGRGCPRKYLVDGSTGLGLAARWPGYTEIRGRSRARLARWLGWPGLDPRADRRALALEAGLWLVALVLLVWLLVRRRVARESSAGMLSLAALLGLALSTLIASERPPDQSSGSLSLLAMVLIMQRPSGPSQGEGDGEGPTTRALALGAAAVVGLLGLSPVGGAGDALGVLEVMTEALASDLGLTWESSRALAASFAVVALLAGLAACVTAMVTGDIEAAPRSTSERQHKIERVGLVLTLLVAVAVALRKPGDDLALAHGAALVLIGTIFGGSATRPWIGLAAVLVLILLTAVSLPSASPVAVGALAVASLVGVAAVLVPPASKHSG